MLILVATPIGNLADISFRALEALKAASYILCEDTRHSQVLLSHYGIQKPLVSYHQFNEVQRLEQIIADLKAGTQIALVSDAGTPAISDPGHLLVQKCLEEGIAVTAVPGPCAAIVALTLSGLSSERFQFLGFLPKKTGELKALLLEALYYPGTTICYESPHRIAETLSLLASLSKTTRACILRELTKHYEERLSGSAEELAHRCSETHLKGEIVLLIEGGKSRDYSPQELVAQLQDEFGLTPQEAIKLAAQLTGLPKRALYKQTHNL